MELFGSSSSGREKRDMKQGVACSQGGVVAASSHGARYPEIPSNPPTEYYYNPYSAVGMYMVFTYRIG